jgi:1-acyl-sn-glycerol-3-phosphate acyltransferase
MALPGISTEGHTVDTLTPLVQEKMNEGLKYLQNKVLKTPLEVAVSVS